MMPYKSKRSPRAKQKEALDRMKGRVAFALLMAMRTGKTKVVLDDFGRLEFDKKVDDLLVFAPGGVYKTWVKAIDDDFSDDLRKRVRIHVWQSGKYGSKKAREELGSFMAWHGPRVLLMNIEALSSVEDARKLAIGFLAQRKSMCAIDESTTIKNPMAKRTKFVLKELKPRADFRRIASGLPTPRSPLDLYGQFLFLDDKILGFKSYYGFRATYAIMRNQSFGGRSVPIIVGYRNVEELSHKIAPHSFRVRLEDCYDLPPDMYSTREVPLTGEQKKIYAELREYATTRLEGERFVTSTIVIDQLLKLHQVLCGFVKDEDGNIAEIPERRIETLLELLEEYDGKAIIWCSYDHSINRVAAALNKEFGEGSVSRFWGGNIKTREAEEKMFLTDPACRFMVATPDAGGMGRTWDNADLNVYFSSKNNLEHRMQSEQRPKGVGKTQSILHVDLIATGTVESKIIYALRNKLDMSTMINGDNYREWLI